MKNERILTNVIFIFPVIFCSIAAILLICVSDAYAQDSTQLSNIVMKFGGKYSQQDGDRLADAILHKHVTAMDEGRYRDYDSMHKLIANTWAGMIIKYDFISINDDGCVGEVKVIERPGGQKWESIFVFVRGGYYGWRLIHYRSKRI